MLHYQKAGRAKDVRPAFFVISKIRNRLPRISLQMQQIETETFCLTYKYSYNFLSNASDCLQVL